MKQRITLLLCSLLFAGLSHAANISGNYTLNTGQPEGGSNFHSLTGSNGFFQFLNTNTIDGDLTLKVQMGLTYSEPGTVKLTNTNPQNKKITITTGSGTGNAIFSLPTATTVSTSWIDIKSQGFTIDGNRRFIFSYDYPNAVPLMRISNTKNVSIRECIFETNTTSSTGAIYIVGNNEIIGHKFISNTFKALGTTPMKTCIAFSVPADSALSTIIVQTNTFSGFSSDGIRVVGGNANSLIKSLTISKNDFFASTASNTTAIKCIDLVTANVPTDGIRIEENSFGGSDTSCLGLPWNLTSGTCYGIYYNLATAPLRPTKITDNLFANINAVGFQAICVESGSVHVTHNTIKDITAVGGNFMFIRNVTVAMVNENIIKNCTFGANGGGAISLNGTGTYDIYNNRISNLEHDGTKIITGIKDLSSGTLTSVYNNVIMLGVGSTTAAIYKCAEISNAPVTRKWYQNSLFIGGSNPGAQTFGADITSGARVSFRNNLIFNVRNSGTVSAANYAVFIRAYSAADIQFFNNALHTANGGNIVKIPSAMTIAGLEVLLGNTTNKEISVFSLIFTENNELRPNFVFNLNIADLSVLTIPAMLKKDILGVTRTIANNTVGAYAVENGSGPVIISTLDGQTIGCDSSDFTVETVVNILAGTQVKAFVQIPVELNDSIGLRYFYPDNVLPPFDMVFVNGKAQFGPAGGFSLSNAISDFRIYSKSYANHDNVAYTISVVDAADENTIYNTATYEFDLVAIPSAGTITGPTEVCVGSTVTLDNAVTGGEWAVTPASVATITPSGVVTGVAPGTATVIYTTGEESCLNTTYYNVTVNPLPEIISSLDGQTVDCDSLDFTVETIGNCLLGASVKAFVQIPVGLNDSIGLRYFYPAGVPLPPYDMVFVNGKAQFGPTGGFSLGNAISSFQAYSKSHANHDNVAYTISIVDAADESIVYNTATFEFDLAAIPSAGTITGPAAVCVGSTITLSNATTGGVWTIAPTSVATISASGVVTGIASGFAKATYTTGTGSCMNLTGHDVTVNALPTVAAITGTTSVCIGSTTTLANTTTGGVWTIAPTSIATINASGVVTGVSAGSATATYTVTNASGCVTAVTAAITVNAKPTVAAITGTTSVCIGSTTTLANTTTGGVWTIATTSVATISASGVVTGVAAGSATATYTVSNTSGCSTAVTAAITVNAKPVAAITGPATANVNITATYTGTPAGMNTYAWTVTDNAGTSTTSTLNATWTTEGSKTVTLQVTDANGCVSAPASKTVTVTNLVNPVIIGSSTACQNSYEWYYVAAGFSTYTWTIEPANAGVIVSNYGHKVQVLWNLAGNHNLKVACTHGAGNGTNTLGVQVAALPGAAGMISGKTAVQAGEKGVVYQTSPVPYATSYVWTIPAGAVIKSGEGTNRITVDFGTTHTTGTIRVYATNACGSGSPASPLTVSIAKGGIILAVENVENTDFVVYPTPNNGNFTVAVANLPRGDYQLAIYNAIGAKVYQTKTTSLGGNLELPVSIDVAKGAYVVVLTDGTHRFTKKMIVTK